MRALAVSAALAMTLVAAPFAIADAFHLSSAKKVKLDAGAIATAEKSATVGKTGTGTPSLSFAGKSVHLVIRTGPEKDMLSFRLQGLRNPSISVRAGATITVLFVNTDDDMLHDFRLTAKKPPFTGDLGNAGSVGSVALPHTKGKEFFGEKLTFKAPAHPGMYSYVCTVRGHAHGGMYGLIRVR